jgi:hypothetical protein
VIQDPRVAAVDPGNVLPEPDERCELPVRRQRLCYTIALTRFGRTIALTSASNVYRARPSIFGNAPGRCDTRVGCGRAGGFGVESSVAKIR